MADFRNLFSKIHRRLPRHWRVLTVVVVLTPILSGSAYYNTTGGSGNLNLFTGLLAAYSFSEGAGTTTADKSGNGYNLAKYVGSPTWTTSGHTGDALVFTTTGDGYDITSNAMALTTAFTIMGWVYPTADPGGGESLLASYVVSGPDWPYGLEVFDYNSSGYPGCYYHLSGSTYPGTGASAKVPINAWTHLACTFDGTNIKFYVNGVLKSSVSAPGTITEGTGGRFVVGADNASDQSFQGRIDDVRLYNRGLSAAEVVQAMNMPVAP